MRLPQINDIWQHQDHDPSKNKYHQYRTWGISQDTPIPDDRNPPAYIYGQHTETGEEVAILTDNEPGFWIWGKTSGLILVRCVVYWNALPYINRTVWVRPLEIFLMPRNDKPRFELLGDTDLLDVPRSWHQN